MSCINKSKLHPAIMKFLDSPFFNKKFLESIVPAVGEFLWHEDDEIYEIVTIFNKEKLASKYPELRNILKEFSNLLDDITKDASPKEEEDSIYHFQTH